MPKLKGHILSRIKAILLQEAAKNPDAQPPPAGLTVRGFDNNSEQSDSVLFKDDRMYSHHLARFNYTTYDVRRAQDVINPSTCHCDIMLLANTGDTVTENGTHHPFLYARVLGIYHVNVVYTGEGMLDYDSRRLYFLWVRWLDYDGHRSVGWNDLALDSVHFPPTMNEAAFGFVDPGEVLRGCHIIPAFASGRAHSDGIGLSRCARDGQDWARYHVNRWVIRSSLLVFSQLRSQVRRS